MIKKCDFQVTKELGLFTISRMFASTVSSWLDAADVVAASSSSLDSKPNQESNWLGE
jgi:hypothetical protein